MFIGSKEKSHVYSTRNILSPICCDLCCDNSKNAFTDFIQTQHAHVYGSGEEPSLCPLGQKLCGLSGSN